MVRSNSENNTYKFNFDRVFDPTSYQQEVYDFAAKNIVESVLEGFNGTIFAYGQTSSGKTHTMQGVIDNPEKEGIIPRMIRHLFNFIVNSSSDTEYIVKVSMIEIYMEKVKDLIDPDRTNLNVREDKAKGIYIEDLSEHYVVSEDEVLEIMKLGSDNRSVAATNMNEHSSRSHSIFIMTIHQNNVKDLSAKTGKLYLVDLAGSEKISKTGATGLTLEEAKTINKSLTTLGMVINSLTDGKSTHIPYRESKLTRVLQESLGGNAKTCLIITCSPSIYNESETLSTLRFGLRAKKIKNKPKINKETTVAELKIEIDKMDKVIQKLNMRIKQLENYIVKNGLQIPLEDESGMDYFEDELEQEKGQSEINIRDDSILIDNNKMNKIDNISGEYMDKNLKSNDQKISFGNVNQEELNNLINNDNISRLTAGFGNLVRKGSYENENFFVNGNLEQLTKINNDYMNRLKELEEENKTLNEQIEFLHEFISRLDKELEFKSNAIENLEITNKKNKEEIDNLKISRIENNNNCQIENPADQNNDNQIKISEGLNNKDNIIEKNNSSNEKDENNGLDGIINNKLDNENKMNLNEIDLVKIEIEKNEGENILQESDNRKNLDSNFDNNPKFGTDLVDPEDHKSNYIKLENGGTLERLSNVSLENKSNKLQNELENNNLNFEKKLIFINSEPKKRSILHGDAESMANFELNQIKSADKEEANKKDFTLLEIFQKLKKEKKITKSTNFLQLENILSNSINHLDVSKKTIGCQTNFDEELNNYPNNDILEDVLNTEYNRAQTEESYINKIDNNLKNNEFYNQNENIDIVDFQDFITKIEKLKYKIQTEKNLIDNIYNTRINAKIENDNAISDKKNISKEETKIDNIVLQLDNLVKEFKEHTKNLNKRNSVANNLNTLELSSRQTLNKKEKFSQIDIEEMQKKIYSEVEDKMFEENRKHENEKKTILKVLEEKCEKFNMLEIENGDLKSKIKSLELKMSPDEKINKKILVKLEQNIDQLNLMLERTVAEKSQLAINLKVIYMIFKFPNDIFI